MGVEDEEARLVGAAADGDHRAFRRLVDRHYDACLRYAARMLDDRADAEDVVQETFVRAYAGLPRYEDRGRFGAWLFRILVNRCRSAAAGPWSTRVKTVPADAVAERELSVDPVTPSPFRRAVLDAALAALPHDQREAFLLKYVDEWTYDEMTGITGSSVSALKMRVARAKEALRERLRGMSDE
jgi:RNA polymerase sigma-70 factor (ECF subfamily)